MTGLDEPDIDHVNERLARAAWVFQHAREEATQAQDAGERQTAIRARHAMRYSHDALTAALWDWRPAGERP